MPMPVEVRELARRLNAEMEDPRVSFDDAVRRLGLNKWETRNLLWKHGFRLSRRLVVARHLAEVASGVAS